MGLVQLELLNSNTIETALDVLYRLHNRRFGSNLYIIFQTKYIFNTVKNKL